MCCQALPVALSKSAPAQYSAVALTAATGVRRNELLAFRWSDFDPEKKTLTVAHALEVTKEFGIRFKPPKTWRGLRTIALDDGSATLLLAERAKHLRILAGIPDTADVVLSIIRLPDDALMFPNPPARGQKFSLHGPAGPPYVHEAV